MLFFNFALKSLSEIKFQQKYLKNTAKNAKFRHVVAYISDNANNPRGISRGDCRSYTCGTVGPLDGTICTSGPNIHRPKGEKTCPLLD